jgi:hypothetical protein
MAERLNQLLEPLLSPTEEKAESGRDAPMEADPAGSCLGETVRAGWERVLHDQSLALNAIPVPQEEADGLDGNCYSGLAGEKTYHVGRDLRLTNNIYEALSDIDGDGSDDDSSFDGSGSDCSESGSVSSESGSDSASRPGATVRFGDAIFLSEEDEDSDSERAGGAGGVFGGGTRRPRRQVAASALPEVEFAFRFPDPQSASAGSGTPCANSENSMQQAAAASSESARTTTVSGPGNGASSGGSKPTKPRRAPTQPRLPRKQFTDEEKANRRKERKKKSLDKLFR